MKVSIQLAPPGRTVDMLFYYDYKVSFGLLTHRFHRL
jgi:hypothetical protein